MNGPQNSQIDIRDSRRKMMMNSHLILAVNGGKTRSNQASPLHRGGTESSQNDATEITGNYMLRKSEGDNKLKGE